MFSSLASLLPSLQLNHNHHSPTPPPFNPNDNPEEVAADKAAESEAAEEPDDIATKKSGRVKSPTETFIFVRPPPAKSNHPLNLQVQLVPPPQARRSSVDEPPDVAITLTRTPSNRSDTSSYSSTASFSSSTSSTSQGRRTIIPLYSLQAHNVMANVIVDAGTDAKIAKLRRSGMEFIDLAILEPVEVWAEKPRFAKTSPSLTPEPSTPTASTASLSSGSLAPHTPIAPRGQLPQQHHLAPPQLGDPALSKKGVPEDAAKRNIFGKMFKKSKDVTPPVSPALSSTFNIKYKAQGADSTPTPGRTTGRGHARNLSASLRPMSSSSRNRSSSPNPLAKFGLLVPGQEEGNVSTSDLSIGGSSDDKPLLPPVLGIQPTLSYCYLSSGIAGAPGPPPVPQTSKPPRALMHVWFVKKWLKRRADSHDTGGLLGVMQMHASRRGSILSTSSSGSLGPLEEGVEVRFEWKRATSKGKTRGKGRERGKEERRGREDADSPEDVKALRRFSALSRHSVSTNFSVSEDGGGKSRPGTPMREGRRERGGSFSSPGQDKDPGEYDEDSDPEDSETPWVCTLKVRRTGVGAGSRDDREYASSTNGSVRNSRKSKGASATETGQQEYDEYGVPLPEPQVLRIKVGTLSPTPHHPKIVAMLKVPFPLPDLEVERIGISRRPLGYTNSRPPPSQWEGTTLTAEEIKDVVCSTGLWLVVREGFGGVGRVSRKGDGWRIRG